MAVHNLSMPNIQSLLKAEIARVVRKELKRENAGLRASVSAYRSEIAALKRRVAELEKGTKGLQRDLDRTRGIPTQRTESSGSSVDLRFQAGGLASNRRRLGLSAADFGLLIGATGKSIYAWEQGQTSPRAKYLEAIAGLRGAGKRDVSKRLAEIKSARNPG